MNLRSIRHRALSAGWLQKLVVKGWTGEQEWVHLPSLEAHADELAQAIPNDRWVDGKPKVPSKANTIRRMVAVLREADSE